MNKKASKKRPRTQKQRRKFIRTLVMGAGLLGTSLLGFIPVLGRWKERIRPPGALPESAFNGACIRCGLCVRDCPYDMLYLGEVGENIPTGTPYFVAREKACEMCEDIPCVAACPTNALDHDLKDINDARMGLAVLVDHESCIAFLGLRCEVCYQICPIMDEAITLERQHNERSGKHALFIPVVHSDRCTGCGKCEEACILEEAAIKVLPRHLAQGELGKHYRVGWEQKERAGGSLVTPDVEHRYNLPEGMRYDHAGEGLIDNGGGETPFSENPLDTLNKQGPR